MVDIVSSQKRSEMMSAIRGKDTKPEIIVRRLLHGLGFRFRLHRKDLPGKPDIVLPRWRVAIFVNGCYWHGHENCHLFRLPKTRTEFWSRKIEDNQGRDRRNYALLNASGLKVVVIWECAVSKSLRLSEKQLQQHITSTIMTDHTLCELRGGTDVVETPLQALVCR